MKKIYYKGNQYIDSSVPVNATATPTANTISKFDLDAKMNSTDMSDAQIDAFMDDIPYAPMVVNDTVPIGAIQAFGGVNAPKNWLLCDGSAVSRTTYAKLYSVIGTTYGTGDGSTTFNLPDLRGRTAIGSGTGTATDATAHTLGSIGGTETVTLDVTQIPSHSHTTGIQGSVAGSMNSGTSSAQVLFDQTSGVSTTSTGGGQAHNNLQPYSTVNYIIKYDDKEITGGGLKSIFDIQETQTLTGIGKTWSFSRIGNIVWLSAPNDSTDVVAGANVIGTLNESMRPTVVQYISPGNVDVSSTGFLIIATDGTITYYAWSAAAGGRNCGFSTSYLTSG